MAATITVRNLDERTQRILKHRAVDHGRSFEAEIRAILVQAALATEPAGVSTQPPSATTHPSGDSRGPLGSPRQDSDPRPGWTAAASSAELLLAAASDFRAAAQGSGFTLPARVAEKPREVFA